LQEIYQSSNQEMFAISLSSSLGAKYSLKSSQNLPKEAKLLFFQKKPKNQPRPQGLPRDGA
jgi:hypothetical protein